MEQLLKQILLTLREEGKTGKYIGARIDESGANKYYGFLSPKAEWYLMVIKSTGEIQYYNEDIKQMTTDQLITAFTTAWTNRVTVTYREVPYVQFT